MIADKALVDGIVCPANLAHQLTPKLEVVAQQKVLLPKKDKELDQYKPPFI